MPIETGTYISDLVVTNPAHGDVLSQSDSHHRLLKSVIKNTFPNITAAVNATAVQLNQLVSGLIGHADGTNTAPSIFFNSETGLGFYRSAAGFFPASSAAAPASPTPASSSSKVTVAPT
jgi:hypothetical protein